MQEDRAADRHRRRVPPRLLAHGLHLPARRHQQGAGPPVGEVPQRRRATSSLPPAGCTSRRISLPEPIFADAFRFLAETAARQTPKLTIPSPSMVHYRGGRAAIDEAVYPDLDAVLERPHRRLRRPGAAIGELGCTYLQFDDTSLAYLNDPEQREHVRAIGGDAEHQHELYIRHINEALEHRPDGMAITTHMCQGNFRSSWVAEGGYDFVAEALFGELDVTASSWSGTTRAPAASSRCASSRRARSSCSAWSRPSAASSRTRTISSAASRRPAQVRRLDQLCPSPQCGFSSTVEGNKLTQEQQAAAAADRRDGRGGAGGQMRAITGGIACAVAPADRRPRTGGSSAPPPRARAAPPS